MKFRVTMKDPDVLHDAIEEAVKASIDVLPGLDKRERDALMDARHEKFAEIAGGVLHSYVSGWTGSRPVDPPVEGAREAVEAFLAGGYSVVIFTCRALTDDGRRGTIEWLQEHGFPVCDVTAFKPHALLYVDDRAFRFEGSWAALMAMATGSGTPRPWTTPKAASFPWGDRAMPTCGECGVEVDQVRADGRYQVCGHRVPGAP